MADGEYYVLADTKVFLDIPAADTADDTYLNSRGLEANRQIDNDLAHVVESVPVASASITDELKGAAVLFVARRYKQKNHDIETSNSYKSDYDDTISGLVNRLNAIPTTRTRIQAVTKEYTTEPLASDPLFD